MKSWSIVCTQGEAGGRGSEGRPGIPGPQVCCHGNQYYYVTMKTAHHMVYVDITVVPGLNLSILWIAFPHGFVKLDRLCHPLLKACMHCVRH